MHSNNTTARVRLFQELTLANGIADSNVATCVATISSRGHPKVWVKLDGGTLPARVYQRNSANLLVSPGRVALSSSTSRILPHCNRLAPIITYSRQTPSTRKSNTT